MGKNNSPWPYRPLSPLRDEFFQKTGITSLFWLESLKIVSLSFAIKEFKAFFAVLQNLRKVAIKEACFEINKENPPKMYMLEHDILRVDFSAKPTRVGSEEKVVSLADFIITSGETVCLLFQNEKHWRQKVVNVKGEESCQIPAHSFSPVRK